MLSNSLCTLKLCAIINNYVYMLNTSMEDNVNEVKIVERLGYNGMGDTYGI